METLTNIGMFLMAWLFFFLLPMPFGMGYAIQESTKKEAIQGVLFWAACSLFFTIISAFLMQMTPH